MRLRAFLQKSNDDNDNKLLKNIISINLFIIFYVWWNDYSNGTVTSSNNMDEETCAISLSIVL